MRDPQNHLEDPRDAARRELRDGERLVWADRPDPAIARRPHLRKFLFAIPFTAFACFWIWGASRGVGQSTMGTIFPFFGLPFLIVGLGMLSAPLRAVSRARSTVYAITDQRLFIATGGKRRSIQSFSPQDITQVERHERGDGLGDVYFAEGVGFLGIAEAHQVEAAVAKLRRSALADSSISA